MQLIAESAGLYQLKSDLQPAFAHKGSSLYTAGHSLSNLAV